MRSMIRGGLFALALVVIACGKKADNETRDKPETSDKEAREKLREITGKRMEAAAEAEKAIKEAETAVKQTTASADEAKAVVDKLNAERADLDTKIQVALDAVLAATSDADRAAAKSKLEALRRARVDGDQRLAEARAAAARAERLKGVNISKECMDNPLAKGCL